MTSPLPTDRLLKPLWASRRKAATSPTDATRMSYIGAQCAVAKYQRCETAPARIFLNSRRWVVGLRPVHRPVDPEKCLFIWLRY